MKNLWSEILVPAVIAGLTVIGTVGVESARTVRPDTRVRLLREVRLDTLRRDTVPQDTGKKAAMKLDTVKTAPVKKDTVLKDLSDDDFDFFGVTVQDADTTPRVFARDTMKVPDSLRITDPFLYRYYVAVKDSFTHRFVVDSLMAAGDTLDWPRIDSLYLADSTLAAKERFERWYAGLSKAERKRYENEKKIARTIHRQDSIQQIKDSLKQIRDSIIENTPRILETAWLPDSLYYKRLVTWKHDPYFNRVETFSWDTTADYHFHDYPYLKEDIGGTFLGMTGSAVQTYNYFKREDPRSTVSYYAPYESWTYTPSSIPMFNTKTPYTELAYYGNLLNSETTSNDDIRIFTTQNIIPSLNIALEYKTYGGAGILNPQEPEGAQQDRLRHGQLAGQAVPRPRRHHLEQRQPGGERRCPAYRRRQGHGPPGHSGSGRVPFQSVEQVHQADGLFRPVRAAPVILPPGLQAPEGFQLCPEGHPRQGLDFRLPGHVQRLVGVQQALRGRNRLSGRGRKGFL